MGLFVMPSFFGVSFLSTVSRWPPFFYAAALCLCPLMLLYCRFGAAYAVVAAGYVHDAVAIVDAV